MKEQQLDSWESYTNGKQGQKRLTSKRERRQSQIMRKLRKDKAFKYMGVIE